MLQSSRTPTKIVVAVLGILAAGIPIVAFNAWVRSQGEDLTTVMAAEALASVEAHVRNAIATLDGLAKEGVNSCRPAHIDAMRQAVLRSGPIKQIVFLGSDGDVQCSDSGASGPRYHMAGRAPGARTDVILDVVQLADRAERFLRVRKTPHPDRPGLAALLPAALLLPQALAALGQAQVDMRVTLSNGTLVSVRDAAQGLPAEAGEQARARLQSHAFAVVATASSASRATVASYDNLRHIGMVITGAAALIILVSALILFRRSNETPIAEIAKAMLANEFEPYYQPVVDIQSARLLGAEVLVRWRRPDGTLVEPNVFVTLMETSGLIPELTRSLMRRVRNELGTPLGRRPKLTIAFNVAPQHFEDALILHDVGTIFDGSPIRLSQIVLELTERHEVENLGATRRTIAALQGLGCKVAIDDVGTGHSGLSYILKLGVDIIKIDKIFVEAIETEGHSRAIIETLIDLAKNMRMEIIAEGVETFDQVTYLRDHGITAAQGYVFAPPLPAKSFLQLLEAMDPIAEETVGPAALAPGLVPPGPDQEPVARRA